MAVISTGGTTAAALTCLAAVVEVASNRVLSTKETCWVHRMQAERLEALCNAAVQLHQLNAARCM